MSTSFAIAATTSVLRSILATGLDASGPGFDLATPSVSTLPPDRVGTGGSELSRLNLFMYQVTPNPGWRNVQLPSRNGAGDRIANPPLAIDLHYLLSAYGQDPLAAETLLGIALHLLHEHPVLTRDRIRAALSTTSSDVLAQKIAAAGLAEQEEQVRITPQPMSIEDISKLWSVFGEKYRPSAAFLATTVLIQSTGRTSEGPPVRQYRVKATPFQTPTITGIEPQFITPGEHTNVSLTGHDLMALDTMAQFGSGDEVAPVPGVSTPEKVVVPIPGSMPSGVTTVRIIQRLHFHPEEKDALHRGFESNVAALVVRPEIAKRQENGDGTYDITLTGSTASPGGTRSGTIRVVLSRPVGREQRVSLFMNALSAPAGQPAPRYSFDAPSRATDTALSTDTINIPVRGLARGDYLVRMRVDGAESELEVDDKGAYTGPRVDIP